MLLKSIKLENIRSYTSEIIEFPEGSVMLSGDIGAGKSSLLLSIEFALFGTSRKHLSASSLLRHGSTQGSVELKFQIENQEIIIKRNLKRGKDDIKQDAGYIIRNGIKEDGTHIELKSKILEILGYPKDLLTKSKDLVYRYTVYTPQEEMKQILHEDKDVRLDTLRKVFNIDKYKRIRENSSILLKDLRQKINRFEGQLIDLDDKKKQLDERKLQQSEVQNKMQELAPKHDEAKQQLESQKTIFQETQKKVEELSQLKNNLALLESQLQNKVAARTKSKQLIEQLVAEINKLSQELEHATFQDLEGDLKIKTNQFQELEKEKLAETKKRIQAESFKTTSMQIKNKIASIDNCPTCEQKVELNHKSFIAQREGKKIAEANAAILQSTDKEKQLAQAQLKLNNEIEQLRKKQQLQAAFKIKKQNLDEKSKTKKQLEDEYALSKQEIGAINMKKIEISQKLESSGSVIEEFNNIKQLLEELQQKERQIAIAKATLDKENQTINQYLELLAKEITAKELVKVELKSAITLKDWINKLFLNLMVTMEKHVMLQIYHEFNELFCRWFNVLMEDEAISVRLNDEFTPILEQNGYETLLDNLSGGEKTSVALAYRLALNQVINNIISQIKTKDILILDEPTDGFSTDQLDKIRDVIDQLAVKQIILVSHENKIESYVDNVIRINKDEHVSSII